METVAVELVHLIRLVESGTAWSEYAYSKAQAMALQNPIEMNELPLLLKNAMILKRCGPPRNYSNQRSRDGSD